MSEPAHTIETRVKKISIKEGKQPGVLVPINGVDTWLTQSLPQYFTGTPAEALNEGDAVKITYKGTFLSMCEKLEPFEATAEDMGIHDAPIKRDATGRSIERQVALKCATELMVALIKSKDLAAPQGTTGVTIAADVAAMAAHLWAALETE